MNQESTTIPVIRGRLLYQPCNRRLCPAERLDGTGNAMLKVVIMKNSV